MRRVIEEWVFGHKRKRSLEETEACQSKERRAPRLQMQLECGVLVVWSNNIKRHGPPVALVALEIKVSQDSSGTQVHSAHSHQASEPLLCVIHRQAGY